MSQPPSKAEKEKQKKAAQKNRNRGGRQQYGHNGFQGPRGDWLAAWNTWSHEYNDDFYQGRLYTSFDPKKRTTGANRAPFRSSDFEKVIPIEKAPNDLKREKMTIKAEGAIMFQGNKEWLSTFYPAPITIDGHQYPSCEHYYQACKLFMLAGPACAMHIRRISDAGRVKQATRQLLAQSGITRDQVDIWKSTHGLLILRHALRHKFLQHKDLQEKLINTGKVLLLHTYAMEKVYATGCDAETVKKWLQENDGKEITIPIEINNESLPYFPKIAQGKNILGIMLMRTRRDCLKLKDLADGEKLEADDPLLHAAVEAMSIQDKPDIEKKYKVEVKKEENDAARTSKKSK